MTDWRGATRSAPGRCDDGVLREAALASISRQVLDAAWSGAEREILRCVAARFEDETR
jgi:hypothetical protein